MSRKTALILTSTLTAFVLIVTAALAVRLGTFNTAPTPAAAVDSPPATVPATAEAVLQRESLYQQRLEDANTEPQQTYEQVRQLQAQLQQLQTLNATLLKRDQIYQQRLQEANRLLQQSAPAAPSEPVQQVEVKRVGHEDEREHEEREYEQHEDDDGHEEHEKEHDDD
ncbi:MAG: hypothetical protein ACE5LU_06380 [Anaerolineae bacterium]